MVTMTHKKETYTKMKMEQKMRFLFLCEKRKLRFCFIRNNKSHGMHAIEQMSIGGHLFSFELTASMDYSGWSVASLCIWRRWCVQLTLDY